MKDVVWQGSGKCVRPFVIKATGYRLDPVFSIQVDCCVATVKDQVNGLFLALRNKGTLIRQKKVYATHKPGSPTYSTVEALTDVNLTLLTVLFSPDKRPPGPVESWPDDLEPFWKQASKDLMDPGVFQSLFEKIGEGQVQTHYDHLTSGLHSAVKKALAIPEFSEEYLLDTYKRALAEMIMDL